MSGTLGIDFFNYLNLMSAPIRKDTLYKGLAQACNEVIGREVDERRRRLSSVHDSAKNRKGDILSQLLYLPEDDKPAIYVDTGLEVTELNEGDIIQKAIITRVISNGNYFGEDELIDYYQVEFVCPVSHKRATWLLPTSSSQERSILLSNSYTMGFDFFNQKISTKEYERLYQFLGMFWPDNGLDDLFIHFIGFIKNMKLDMVPLWALDDGTDYIHVLKPDSINKVHASQGGPWYLTSHVQVRFDLALQNAKYPIDTDEIEELFYLFAPIMLVLDSIVGYLDAPLQVFTGIVGQVEVVNYGIQSYESKEIVPIQIGLVAQVSATNYGIFSLMYEDLIEVTVKLRSYTACQTGVVLYGIFEDFSDWEYFNITNPLHTDINQIYPVIDDYSDMLNTQELRDTLNALSGLALDYFNSFDKGS